jgi:hypothetical protein
MHERDAHAGNDVLCFVVGQRSLHPLGIGLLLEHRALH